MNTEFNTEHTATPSRRVKLAIMACFTVATLMLISSLSAHSATNKKMSNSNHTEISKILAASTTSLLPR